MNKRIVENVIIVLSVKLSVMCYLITSTRQDMCKLLSNSLNLSCELFHITSFSDNPSVDMFFMGGCGGFNAFFQKTAYISENNL